MINVLMFLLTYFTWHAIILGAVFVINGTLPYFGYIEPIYIILYILATSCLVAISILPALFCRTGVKLIIFILCFFFSPTILGWILLMIWAQVANNAADRREHEQEMLELLRDRGRY